jgi:NADP-dependent 3-hydroxy acid dehydrogenase YdfG
MNRRVLITGTTSGIGRGLLRHYHDQGWDILAVNRRSDPELERAYPGVHFHVTDVREAAKVTELVKSLAEKNELPDIWYLNAGINKVDNAENFDLETFREVLEINLLGVLTFVSAALPLLKDKGSTFVTTSSTSNIFPNPNNLGYYVTKWSGAEIFRLLDERHKKRGIRFKALILGPVATNIFAGGVLTSKLQTRVRDFLMLAVDDVVPRIARFVASRRRVFYFSKTAVAVFLLAALVKKVMPGFYKGSAPAKAG